MLSSPIDENSLIAESSNKGASNLEVEEILVALEKLPKKSRLVFNLYLIEGYSHKEIAGLLKISIGTSKWHLSTSRKSVIKELEAKNK